MHAVIYILCYIWLYINFFHFKKSNQKLNSVHWIIITAFLVSCTDTFIIAVLSSICLNTFKWWLINVCHIICGGILFIISIYRKSENQNYKQAYYFSKTDLCVMLGLLALAYLIGSIRYNYDFSVFRYYIHDAVRHLDGAIHLTESKEIRDMFFAHLEDAKLMYVFGNLLPKHQWYRIFSLYQTLKLFSAGAFFWIIIHKYIISAKKIKTGIFMTVMYILGYPLYIMLCGYEYWGVSAIIISFILYISELYTSENMDKGFLVYLFMIANTSLVACYNLFAPAVFIGEFIFLTIFLYKNKALFTCKTLLSGIIGLGIPTFLFIWRTYFILMNCSTNIIDTAFNYTNTSIHRSLFSDLILIGFFVILYILRKIKNHENDISICLLVTTFVCMVYMLIQIYLGNSQTYYYFKFYNILWLLAFYTATKAMAESETNLYFRAYAIGVAILALIAWSDIEYETQYWSDEFKKTGPVHELFSLYYENHHLLTQEVCFVNEETQDIYNYAARLSEQTNQTIPIFSDDEVWAYENYYFMTVQDMEDYYGICKSGNNILPYVENAPYVLVNTYSLIYSENQTIFNSLTPVYQKGNYILYKVD